MYSRHIDKLVHPLQSREIVCGSTQYKTQTVRQKIGLSAEICMPWNTHLMMSCLFTGKQTHCYLYQIILQNYWQLFPFGGSVRHDLTGSPPTSTHKISPRTVEVQNFEKSSVRVSDTQPRELICTTHSMHRCCQCNRLRPGCAIAVLCYSFFLFCSGNMWQCNMYQFPIWNSMLTF